MCLIRNFLFASIYLFSLFVYASNESPVERLKVFVNAHKSIISEQISNKLWDGHGPGQVDWTSLTCLAGQTEHGDIFPYKPIFGSCLVNVKGEGIIDAQFVIVVSERGTTAVTAVVYEGW